MIPVNATWSQSGVTIVSDLKEPQSIVFVDDQTILIADLGNHRIMQYNKNGMEGKVVAGGRGSGTELYQLNQPINFLIDHENDSLIICENGNRRVIQWSLQNITRQGAVLLNSITCSALALDEQRNLYVSDTEKNEVRRYQLGEKNGTLVAGGNGAGSNLNQLSNPYYLFVDREMSVYVSDNKNQRVMKWNKDATAGVIVAGGKGSGSSLDQLAAPDGLFVDSFGTVYVVEHDNNRVTRWHEGAKAGTVIAGGHGLGSGANQFKAPFGLSFDLRGNLYVADTDNGRVQYFAIE